MTKWLTSIRPSTGDSRLDVILDELRLYIKGLLILCLMVPPVLGFWWVVWNYPRYLIILAVVAIILGMARFTGYIFS